MMDFHELESRTKKADGMAVPVSIIWRTTCVVASGLILLTAENLWLDQALKSRWHRAPSLVPESGSGLWVLLFAIIGVSCVLLTVCVVFLLKELGFRAVQSWGGAALTGVAVVLCVLWFRTTGLGLPAPDPFATKPHTVTLKWKASTSVVDGYNVYRRGLPDGTYYRINESLVTGLSFVDEFPASGVRYSYVVRSVAKGQESRDSEPAEADVP